MIWLAKNNELDHETVTFVKQNLLKCIFYDSMCADCGDFNYAKAFQTDVKGKLPLLQVLD
jgi:hypothetical protein